MRCPYCSHDDSKVVDSRDVSEAVRRRRECLNCGSRFTTYERPERAPMLVTKKDGRREEFSREKLLAGIRKACAKRPVSQETIERTVDEIEAQLHRLGKGEVRSAAIGDMVIERLRRLDGVAYIRFASVYRAFADIEEVKREADAYARMALSPADTAQLPLFPDEELEGFSRGAGRRDLSKDGEQHNEPRKRVRASAE